MGKDDCCKEHDCCECSDSDSESGVCSKINKKLRIALIGFAVVVVLVLFTTLIIYLVLQPKKPRFMLQDLTVSQFNLTGPPESSLTTFVRSTVAFHNPNDRIGIYFDRYHFYLTYKNQQITATTEEVPLYEGHNDVQIWTFDLVGCDVPVAPYLYEAITVDKCAGYIILTVKMEARIRWKVGQWTSGNYNLAVSCPVFLSFQDIGGQLTVQFRQASKCSVSV